MRSLPLHRHLELIAGCPGLCRLLGLLTACFFLATSPLHAQEGSTVFIPLTLYIDNSYAGDIDVRITQDERVDIESEAFISALDAYVEPEIIEQVQSCAGEGYIPLECLKAAGIIAGYDSETLQISVEIPARLKRSRPISIQPGLSTKHMAFPTASPFSAYVNLHSNLDIIYTEYETDSQVHFPFTLIMEPNLQLHTWVLENRTGYYSGPDPVFELDYLRLVKDFPHAAVRLETGTNDSPGGGFLSDLPLIGATLRTHDTLKNAYGSSHTDYTEVTVEEPAEILVYLNGRLIKRSRVDPGRYQILDFPYATGLNALRIEIVKKDGTREVLQESVPFDTRLLPLHDSKFSLGAGVLRSDPSIPAFTGFASYGLGTSTTVSGHVQSDLETYIFGPEIIQSLKIGTFSGTASFSFDERAAFGYSGQLLYRLAFPSNSRLPSFGMSGLYTSPEYVKSIRSSWENRYPWQFSVQIGQRLPFRSYLTLMYGYRIGDRENPDRGNGSLLLLKNLGESSSLSFHYSLEYSSEGDFDWNAGIYLTLRPDGSSKTVRTGQDLKTGEGEFSYSASSKRDRGKRDASSSYSLSLQGYPPDTASGTSLRGTYRYDNDLFRTSAGNYLTAYHSGGNTFTNRSSFSLSSAILFADKRFALARSIRDGFIFVTPDDTLQDEVLSVKNGLSGGIAKETLGKTVVLPNITSYTPVSLYFDTPMSSLQTVLSQDRVEIVPSYKSGTVIHVGIKQTTTISGLLHTLDGKPIPLQAGVIRPADPTRETEEILFFSDRNGRFQIHDIEPGEYFLNLFAEELAQAGFTVPQGEESPLEIGEIVLPVILEGNRMEAE